MIACIDGGLICIPLAILLFMFPPSWWLIRWIDKKKNKCDCKCHDKKMPEMSDYPDTESWSKDYDARNKFRKHSRVWDDL
jgi:hypothetical protein